MAGDWIKMRTSLLTNPKVNGIAKFLEGDPRVSKKLSTGFSGCMSEIVTRNVMRCVTVTSLLIIWGAANEHTKDGVFLNSEFSDLDDMVGIPNFGVALESVGWAVYDEENNNVTLPNFNEYNTSGSVRSATAKTGAERQKQYRERKLSEKSDEKSDVTSNRREEKRREDIDIGDSVESSPSAKSKSIQKPDGVSDQLWSDLKAVWKTKRKPITETAIAKIKKVSHETSVPVADVIFMIVDGNWQGIESEWVRNKLKISPQAQSDLPVEGQKRIHNGEHQTFYKLVGWVCEGGRAA